MINRGRRLFQIFPPKRGDYSRGGGDYSREGYYPRAGGGGGDYPRGGGAIIRRG